jgi:pimeloyl-ACP methyl ester carboxylesterase
MLTYLALHYWAGSGREFELLLPLLPPGSQLLAPDLPGFGSQAAPAGFDYSVASYADWVAQYIEDKQIIDYQIIGHSMSGKIALALAARRPAGLRGLILLSPSPPTPEPISDADRAASLAAYGQRAEAEKTFAKITSIPLSDEWREQVITDNLRTTQAAWDAWLLRGSREDISALMPRIEVPCRLLVGENDHAIPLAVQRQQTLPLLPAGTALVAVPGAGHLLPLEAPQVIFSA